METRVLRWILGFGVVTTGLHFTHNFVKIEDYPDSAIPDWVVQAAIVVSWPIFTWVAIRAYRLFAERGSAAARPWLLAWAAWSLFSLGHFTEGNPDIPAFWYATIFTDVLAGLLVVGFVAWSARSTGRSAPAAG